MGEPSTLGEQSGFAEPSASTKRMDLIMRMAGRKTEKPNKKSFNFKSKEPRNTRKTMKELMEFVSIDKAAKKRRRQEAREERMERKEREQHAREQRLQEQEERLAQREQRFVPKTGSRFSETSYRGLAGLESAKNLVSAALSSTRTSLSLDTKTSKRPTEMSFFRTSLSLDTRKSKRPTEMFSPDAKKSAETPSSLFTRAPATGVTV
jgi:hypothetical protein